MSLPRRVADMVGEVLSYFASGHVVRVSRMQKEVTVHDAAELLHVSRTHLIGLLDQGQIPHRVIGAHRRIALSDLLAYQDQLEKHRAEALRAMANDAEQLKLYE
jgi:excisionase family DNA binding protein